MIIKFGSLPAVEQTVDGESRTPGGEPQLPGRLPGAGGIDAEVPPPLRELHLLVEALDDFQGVGLDGPRVPQREGEPALPGKSVDNLLDLSGRGPDDLQGASF